ncbi:MAG: hypothetical protein PUG16_07880, partial [Lachnospiraceae bacterium]|nr:hypothetical protein [Lachnospiraceae bacterium]
MEKYDYLIVVAGLLWPAFAYEEKVRFDTKSLDEIKTIGKRMKKWIRALSLVIVLAAALFIGNGKAEAASTPLSVGQISDLTLTEGEKPAL